MLLRAEAQGTRGGRLESGAEGGGVADMRPQPLSLLPPICCKSHASPSKGIVLYWGSVWSQDELPAYLN